MAGENRMTDIVERLRNDAYSLPSNGEWLERNGDKCAEGQFSSGRPLVVPLYTSAPTIPEGWLKQVVEYLERCLETPGLAESLGSHEARALLSAAPKGEQP